MDNYFQLIKHPDILIHANELKLQHIFKGYEYEGFVAIYKNVTTNNKFGTLALSADHFKPLNDGICEILFD